MADYEIFMASYEIFHTEWNYWRTFKADSESEALYAALIHLDGLVDYSLIRGAEESFAVRKSGESLVNWYLVKVEVLIDKSE